MHCALVQKRAQPLGWTLFARRVVRNFSRRTCRRKNDPVLSAAWRREMGGHTGPSLHGVGSVQEPAGSGVETDLAPAERDGARPLQGAGAGLRRRGEVTPPYGSNTGGAKERADVGIGPYGEKGRFPQPPRPAAHSAASAPRMGGTRRNRSRGQPKRGHQPRAIPQSRLRRASSLYTREPCPAGDGGCGSPRRCAPRNDSPKPLSFRGGPTGRRGNPSFLRWTGVRAAVPRAWPPPTKFRAEIWGVGQVVGPYGRSAEVPATGRCGRRPLRNETEARRDCWGSALSAERVAGQIQSLPDDLRGQHGAQRPEV